MVDEVLPIDVNGGKIDDRVKASSRIYSNGVILSYSESVLPGIEKKIYKEFNVEKDNTWQRFDYFFDQSIYSN